MIPLRAGPLFGLTFAAPVILSVAFASCTSGAWLARRAAARAEEASRGAVAEEEATFDQRSIAVAELLLAALRQDGVRTLARLPQAAPEEQRIAPLAVHEKIVVVVGTVRDFRYERGLFTGRMRIGSGDEAYFVTPIAIEGVAVDHRCAFRGMPVAVRTHEATREPAAILVGAFDGC